MAEEPSVPPAVNSWLAQQAPTTRILTKADMDTESCGPVQGHPGMVAADFDGDGESDYALLLVVGAEKRTTQWQGRSFHLFDMRATVLMSDGEDGFEEIELERFEADIPSISGLELQPPGLVTTWDRTTAHTLRRPGFIWYFCEKAASVVFWEDGRFQRIWTAD